LAMALTKARQVWLGKDAMQKAIDKWSWNIVWEELVEMYYEWYGPSGIAMYIKCITPNTNRSASNVKAILTKYGGNMWEPGSVSWQFTQIGELVIDGKVRIEQEKWNDVEYIDPIDSDAFEIAVIESGASDYEIEENTALVTTTMEDWVTVDKRFTKHDLHTSESWLTFVAENTIELDEKAEEKLQRLIDVLEEDEDVDTVRHNAG
jgi:YebC/PmpR family DNA-binding regulatory protein